VNLLRKFWEAWCETEPYEKESISNQAEEFVLSSLFFRFYVKYYSFNELHGEESFLRANSHSDSHEIPHFLWNPKIHYRIQKVPSLIPILRQMQPLHTSPTLFPYDSI
jgi:hypothetical protein